MTMSANTNTLNLSANNNQFLNYGYYNSEPTNLNQSYNSLLGKQVEKYEYINLTINEIKYELEDKKNIPVDLLKRFSNQVKDINLPSIFNVAKKFDGKKENLSELLYLIRLYGVIKQFEKRFQYLTLSNLQYVN